MDPQLYSTFKPLRPEMAKIGAGTLLAITRQPLELESYSNPLRIQQVSWSKSKKTFFVFVEVFLEVTSQIGVFLRYFGHLCLALGAVLKGHFWTQSLVEN